MKVWLIVFGIVLNGSCSKSDQPLIPTCISELIRVQKESISEVYQYTFQGKKVFEFVPQGTCCDLANTIYSENCIMLCSLFGITGNQICQSDTFYLKATDKVQVWKK